MKRLFFDVATSMMYIALTKEDKIIDFNIRIAKQDHATYLVDRIAFILERNQLTLEDIDEIVVGYGPGSYTGIRIAVMVAKMFAYTKKITLKVVSSLLFLSSGYEEEVMVLIDARRKNYFSMAHHKGRILIEDLLRSEEEIKRFPYSKVILDEDHFKIDVAVILKNAILIQDVHALEPNYLRITEAEASYDQKNAR